MLVEVVANRLFKSGDAVEGAEANPVLRVLGDGRGLAVPGIPVHLPQATASEVADGLEGYLGFHLFRGGLKAASSAENQG